MKHKYNPMLSLVALLLLALILVLSCTGCAVEAAAETTRRFTSESFYGPYVDYLIITDNETGVQYLYIDDYNAGGLCVLQPGED